MKREFTNAEATSMPSTPQFLDDIQISLSEPLYPWQTIHPQCLDRSFQPEAQFIPAPQVSQFQVSQRLKSLLIFSSLQRKPGSYFHRLPMETHSATW